VHQLDWKLAHQECSPYEEFPIELQAPTLLRCRWNCAKSCGAEPAAPVSAVAYDLIDLLLIAGAAGEAAAFATEATILILAKGIGTTTVDRGSDLSARLREACGRLDSRFFTVGRAVCVRCTALVVRALGVTHVSNALVWRKLGGKRKCTSGRKRKIDATIEACLGNSTGFGHLVGSYFTCCAARKGFQPREQQMLTSRWRGRTLNQCC
jgi:hypothetical protein